MSSIANLWYLWLLAAGLVYLPFLVFTGRIKVKMTMAVQLATIGGVFGILALIAMVLICVARLKGGAYDMDLVVKLWWLWGFLAVCNVYVAIRKFRGSLFPKSETNPVLRIPLPYYMIVSNLLVVTFMFSIVLNIIDYARAY